MDKRIIDYEEETDITQDDYIALDNVNDRPVKLSVKKFIQEVDINGANN